MICTLVHLLFSFISLSIIWRSIPSYVVEKNGYILFAILACGLLGPLMFLIVLAHPVAQDTILKWFKSDKDELL